MLSIKIALLALAAAVAPTNAFFRMNCAQPVTTMRADPIVTPGLVASHVHQVRAQGFVCAVAERVARFLAV